MPTGLAESIEARRSCSTGVQRRMQHSEGKDEQSSRDDAKRASAHNRGLEARLAGMTRCSVALYSDLLMISLGSVVACFLRGLIILGSTLHGTFLTILYHSVVCSIVALYIK